MCIDVSIMRFIGRVSRTHCPASRIKRLASMRVHILFSLFINRIYIYNTRAYNREEMRVYVASHTGVLLFYFYFYRRYGLFFFSFILSSSLFHLLRRRRNEKKEKISARPSIIRHRADIGIAIAPPSFDGSARYEGYAT